MSIFRHDGMGGIFHNAAYLTKAEKAAGVQNSRLPPLSQVMQ
ncbi:MAG: hypothetical protein ACR2P4_03890 [Gammaproteobacteria bacterium]